MGITSDTWWKVTCDRCNKDFPENEADGAFLAESEDEACEMVTDYDAEFRDGKIICSDCIEDEKSNGQEGSDAD